MYFCFFFLFNSKHYLTISYNGNVKCFCSLLAFGSIDVIINLLQTLIYHHWLQVLNLASMSLPSKMVVANPTDDDDVPPTNLITVHREGSLVRQLVDSSAWTNRPMMTLLCECQQIYYFSLFFAEMKKLFVYHRWTQTTRFSFPYPLDGY